MNSNNTLTLEVFSWNSSYETGIQQIDKEHKELVRIMNSFAAHLANRSGDDVLSRLLNELLEYSNYHFKSEDRIWSEYFDDDEWYKTHQSTHNSFIDELVLLKNSIDKESLDDALQDIIKYLTHWACLSCSRFR